MSPEERRLLQFIDARIESILHRPTAWGSLESVEDQILQLLELRHFVLDPRKDPQTNAPDTRPLMCRYTRYISRVLPKSTAEPLSSQLTARGRTEEFSALMRQFVQSDTGKSNSLGAFANYHTSPADLDNPE